MELSKDLKKILISSVALLMTGSIIGTGNVANAKHRRYHYRYTRRARRNVYKYGYYKYGRYHYYKTGYFRNGKWIKRHIKSYKHPKYMWVSDPNTTNKYIRVRVVGKKYMNNEKDEPYYIFKSNNKNLIYANGWPVRHGYGAAWGQSPDGSAAYIFAHNPAESSNNNNDSNDSSGNVTTPVHHSHTNSVAKNLAEMKSQTVTDINNDRENNGVTPLHESAELDQIANMRAKQELSHQGHVDPNTGYVYADEDGYKLGYNDSPSHEKYGENLADTALNIEEIRSDGTSYYDKNGKEAADDTNDSLMNHDTSSDPSTNWGHRDNILHSGYHYVGVGTSYNKNNKTYYDVEDFD